MFYMGGAETQPIPVIFNWLLIKVKENGSCDQSYPVRYGGPRSELNLVFASLRKVMTNLDSIFKSRDITLPTKVHLVKAVVFPVVMYGCESWTMKKAEHQRIDAFELWCWTRLLRVPWTAMRSNQSILRRSALGFPWKE